MKILIKVPFKPESYTNLLASSDGKAMNIFIEVGQAISKRYFKQIEGISPSEPFLEMFLEAIWTTVHGAGLPVPLGGQEMGEPLDPDYEYLNQLTDQCLDQLPRHRAEDQLRALCVQMLISLLSPEFKSCRQSYIVEESGGGCLRQSREHCEERISGSHCEDCPYFTALTEMQHRKLLSRVWSSDSPTTFESSPKLFLPEDFRSLRIFWHLHIRYGN